MGEAAAAAAAAAPLAPPPRDDDDARQKLVRRWPERKGEIVQLLGLLGAPHDHAVPIFVHGPPVTGKSSIVRDVFTTTKRPFAYVSLVDAHNPRLLLDAIVEELAPYLTGLTEKQTRCDRFADLISVLHRGLAPDAPAVYLVIDVATRLLDWKSNDPLLPALMKISELTGRNVGAMLIATPGWDAFRSAAMVRPPVLVYFDAYTNRQLRDVLTRERPKDADATLYRDFLGAVLPTFFATCKSLHELRALLAPLWRRYVAPWEEARDGRDLAAARRGLSAAAAGGSGSGSGSGGGAEGAQADDDVVVLPEARTLWARLASGRTAESVAAEAAAKAAAEARGVPPPPRKKTGPVLHAGLAVPLSSASLALQRGEWPVPEDESGAGALDFDIPRLTKFMLVSAHLATMNREAVDKRLFGHMIEGVRAGTAAVAQRSGKRKRGALSADKQSEAAATAALDGPGTFSLERLLAYFRVVTKQAYDEDGAGDGDLARELLSADVFMQISSMVALGLLTRTSGGDALDGCRYRCDVGNDLARKIAADPAVRVNLDNYLFYV